MGKIIEELGAKLDALEHASLGALAEQYEGLPGESTTIKTCPACGGGGFKQWINWEAPEMGWEACKVCFGSGMVPNSYGEAHPRVEEVHNEQGTRENDDDLPELQQMAGLVGRMPTGEPDLDSLAFERLRLLENRLASSDPLAPGYRRELELVREQLRERMQDEG